MSITTYGDTSGNLTGHERGGNQTSITLPSNLGVPSEVVINTAYGDANALFDYARGGNDILTGGMNSVNVMVGDAHDMYGNSIGGNDLVIGGDNTTTQVQPDPDIFNSIYGDAITMHDTSVGGNDKLVAGFNDRQLMFGDASVMDGNSIGGNDLLIGGNSSVVITEDSFPSGVGSQMWGDANDMHGHARGGNDTLIGGSELTDLYGDAFHLYDSAQGGNDILIAGSGRTTMTGDARLMDPGTHGGADTFVFAPGMWKDIPDPFSSIGAQVDDVIFDFRHGDHDKIDVSAFGFHDISNLTITPNVAWAGGTLPDGTHSATGTVIQLGNTGSSILLEGLTTPLTTSDFIFAPKTPV